MSDSRIAMIVVLGIFAPSASPAPSPIEAIRRIETLSVAAASARDLDRLVSYYAEDTIVISPGEEPIRGRAAFLVHLEPLRRAPLLEVRKTPDTIEVAASGDLAYVRGTYENRYTDPTTRKISSNWGTYVAIYKRSTDSAWRIALDITAPAADAKARPATAPR